MKKRLVSLVLSIVIIVTILPANCFAAGVSCAYGSTCAAHAAEVNGLHYDTIDEAIKAAKDGDIICIHDTSDNTYWLNVYQSGAWHRLLGKE